MSEWNREIGERGTGTRDWAIGADACPPLRTRGLLGAGYTCLGAGYRYVRLSPLWAHIGACVRGHADYLVGDAWVRAAPGTVLVAPAGMPHGSQSIALDRAGSGHIAWVLFTPVERSTQRRTWDAGTARVLHGRDVRPLWWALQGLYVEASGPAARASSAAVGQWCDVVLSTAIRLAESDAQPGDPTRAVWEEVDLDLRHPWTVQELAALASLSETHFRRVCRRTLGAAPARHLAQLRMRRAALLLTTTQDKLATIANEVGYRDVFAFSVAFKRYSGIVPSAYRAHQSARRDAAH